MILSRIILASGTALLAATGPLLPVGLAWAVDPPSEVASTLNRDRLSYQEVPLSQITTVLSGDPEQLPLLAVKPLLEEGSQVPQVILDRSDAERIIATVTQLSATAQPVVSRRYRVEMVKNPSPCSCQQWRVTWVGQQ